MSWSNDHVRCLLNEYQKYPSLYAVKTKDYKNRHARAQALNAILKELQDIKPGVSILEIKNKFNGLKSNFMTEYKKVDASRKSGSGSDDLYIPSLWYYDIISFLLEHNEPRLAIDSIDENLINVADSEIGESSQECLVDENTESYILDDVTGNYVALDNMATPSCSTSTSAGYMSRKRKRSTSNENAFLKQASTVIQDISNTINTKNKLKKTEDEIFGEFIASKLGQIKNKEVKLQTELEITNIIYKALMHCENE